MAYEVGAKSELFDHRIRVNGALFWNDIENPQVLEVVTPPGGVPGTALINAQGARTRGGEVSVEAIVASGLRLSAGATYLDAKYTHFLNAPYYAVNNGSLTGPFARDASGNRLPEVPRWRVNVGANYALNSGIGHWVADVSASYTGRFAWPADNIISQKPVTLVNATLNFTPASNQAVTLSLWGKNLAGVHYEAFVQEQVGLAGNSEFQASPAPPLTFGGTVSLKFR